jgi:transposase-like protein
MSRKILVPPKQELIDIYAKEGNTISSLARLYNTSNPTVRSWLVKYEIERKDQKQASTEANNRHKIHSKPTKEALTKLYEESTIKSLSSYYNVSLATIYEWLLEYDIQTRTLSESTKKCKQIQYENIQFTKEYLVSQYDTKQSILVLAEKLGVSKTHIRKQLLINGIKILPIDPSWRSKAEISLYEYLTENFPNDNWKNNDKSIIQPFELDIVNIDKKIAIEYCGLYWHSEASSGKKKNYHKNKYLMCKEKGYKLVTIFESDNMEKVKNLLLKLFGKTIKIGARNTTLKALTPTIAGSFHKEHHLHSSVGAAHHYGLYQGEELVMAASFGKNRFSDKYEYECTRITSHSKYTVVGGVSKLIANFIKLQNPQSIITFADLRFGDGNVYPKCGFEFVGLTDPNYWYWKKNTSLLYSRVKFQKHKLKDLLDFFDPTKTEFENMLENDWDRVWDCGNGKYHWINPNQ